MNERPFWSRLGTCPVPEALRAVLLQTAGFDFFAVAGYPAVQSGGSSIWISEILEIRV